MDEEFSASLREQIGGMVMDILRLKIELKYKAIELAQVKESAAKVVKLDDERARSAG